MTDTEKTSVAIRKALERLSIVYDKQLPEKELDRIQGRIERRIANGEPGDLVFAESTRAFWKHG